MPDGPLLGLLVRNLAPATCSANRNFFNYNYQKHPAASLKVQNFEFSNQPSLVRKVKTSDFPIDYLQVTGATPGRVLLMDGL